jgi:UDP:flavonoid glycosyltransferase YjiC (YdhE family)
MIADLPEFIPCRNLPAHFRYVGPLIWEPSIQEPAWLGELRTDVPTVYVTLGSTVDRSTLVSLLTGLRDGGYQVLATVGSRMDDLPAGIHAAAYAPGSALLRRSQAVICHGGNLTIYQAIREGVPIVGIPTWHDQELNLDRVEAMGWGVSLRPRRWTNPELLTAVKRVGGVDFQERVQVGRQQICKAIAESESQGLLDATSGRGIAHESAP